MIDITSNNVFNLAAFSNAATAVGIKSYESESIYQPGFPVDPTLAAQYKVMEQQTMNLVPDGVAIKLIPNGTYGPTIQIGSQYFDIARSAWSVVGTTSAWMGKCLVAVKDFQGTKLRGEDRLISLEEYNSPEHQALIMQDPSKYSARPGKDGQGMLSINVSQGDVKFQFFPVGTTV